MNGVAHLRMQENAKRKGWKVEMRGERQAVTPAKWLNEVLNAQEN